MWTAIVDTAIEENTQLVALSGDVIDQANDAYEAVGPFLAGLERLATAGIQTVAVSGNHDHSALPRVAAAIETDHFHLLGEKGSWEHHIVEIDGTPVLDVVGWSYPREYPAENPLSRLQLHPSYGLPVLGLLHTELNTPRSRFAQIRTEDLWTHDVALWLLGHIHVPGRIDGPGSQVALYPGSPLAMDPGEPGVHGVWLVELSPGVAVDPVQLHTSPVRYVSATIDVSDVVDEDSFFDAVVRRLINIGQDALESDNRSMLRDVSCRIELRGSSPAHRQIPAWADRAQPDLTQTIDGRIEIRVERISNIVTVPIDLVQLSRGNDPVAETAKLLLALSNDEIEQPTAGLVEQTQNDLLQIYNNPGYSALLTADREIESVDPSEQDARDLLTERGWSLLSSLLAQKDGIDG